MDGNVVVVVAVGAATFNIGFLAGRVFERWEWVAREKRLIEKRLARRTRDGRSETR